MCVCVCVCVCVLICFLFSRYTMAAVPATRLADVFPLTTDICVIGIDEGQFVSLTSEP